MTVLHASLIRLIERIIQSPAEGFSSAIYPGPEAAWPRQGRHFSLQKDGAPTIIYPWFGFYDTAFGLVIYIGFSAEAGWCEVIYDAVQLKGLTGGITYRKPFADLLRKELCFMLDEDHCNRFKSTIPIGVQEKILSDFFTEVMGHIAQYLV
jgi:hypothetical protein